MLNHVAWATRDVEAVAEFYTKIMGMKLATTVMDDKIPSTGEEFPYFHIFFRMRDGSTIAFFEAPGLPERPPVAHPAYELFDHIALQVDDANEVDRWHQWLVSNGIDVVGPTNHGGLIYSIYFHDPDGLRLEITTPLDPHWNNHTEKGHEDLKLWAKTKAEAKRNHGDVATALVDLIRKQRALRE